MAEGDGVDDDQGSTGADGEAPEGEADAPVARIARLSLEPDPEFGPRLHRRINRRLFAGDLTDLSLAALAYGFLQFLLALLGLARRDGEEREGNET